MMERMWRGSRQDAVSQAVPSVRSRHTTCLNQDEPPRSRAGSAVTIPARHRRGRRIPGECARLQPFRCARSGGLGRRKSRGIGRAGERRGSKRRKAAAAEKRPADRTSAYRRVLGGFPKTPLRCGCRPLLAGGTANLGRGTRPVLPTSNVPADGSGAPMLSRIAVRGIRSSNFRGFRWCGPPSPPDWRLLR
jgi:hypothetical protein